MQTITNNALIINSLLIKEQPRTQVTHFRNNDFKTKIKKVLIVKSCQKITIEKHHETNNHDYTDWMIFRGCLRVSEVKFIYEVKFTPAWNFKVA